MWKAPNLKEKRRTNSEKKQTKKKKQSALQHFRRDGCPMKNAGPCVTAADPLQLAAVLLRLAESERRVTALRPTDFMDPVECCCFFCLFVCFTITTGLFQKLLPLTPSSTAVSILAELFGEGSRALTSLPVRAPHKHSIVCENVQCAQGTLHIWQLLLATSLGPVSTPPGEDCMHGCAP